MKFSDKIAIERFRQRCELIALATDGVPFQESKEDKERRIKLLLNDYNAFTKYYFPQWTTVDNAPFHLHAARKISANKKLMAVFEWARGHAKSTHFDIMIPMWLKARGELHVMVLVGKNEQNAITLLSDLQAELEHNQRYIHDFGDQVLNGNWEDGRFATKDNCGFFALGRGQSPRGLRYKQYRPDYIVLDDIDDDELVRNPARVDKLTDWALQALYFTMDMGRGRFIVVGNRIANRSVLANIAEKSSVYHHKVNALDNDGKPSWTAKYSVAEIEEVIQKIGYRAAQKELFNNPITEGAVFKKDWLRFAPALDYYQYDAIIGYCDPSFKNSATSDYKAIMLVGKKATQYHILECFVRKCTIGEMVRWLYDYNDRLPNRAVAQYYMEANFIQDLILNEFDEEGKARGYILPIRADHRKKPDKFARIEAISPLFERGFVIINEAIKDKPDTQLFIEQLLSFEKGSNQHDDAPDALEGAIWLLNKYCTQKEYIPLIHQRNNRRF